MNTIKARHEKLNIILDDRTPVEFPDESVWAYYYGKFRDQLMSILKRHSPSVSDVEDAVEEAFHKLMHKKDRISYGDSMPTTEKDWFWTLYWQSRAYLSHLKDRGAVHAKYVERIAVELKDAFADCNEMFRCMDDSILTRALVRALETLKDEQDISRRNFEVYVSCVAGHKESRDVAAKFGISPNNVDQIKWRVGRLIRKYGPRHFEAAICHEAYSIAA